MSTTKLTVSKFSVCLQVVNLAFVSMLLISFQISKLKTQILIRENWVFFKLNKTDKDHVEISTNSN